jgi:hypothetical protein
MPPGTNELGVGRSRGCYRAAQEIKDLPALDLAAEKVMQACSANHLFAAG